MPRKRGASAQHGIEEVDLADLGIVGKGYTTTGLEDTNLFQRASWYLGESNYLDLNDVINEWWSCNDLTLSNY